MYNKELCKRICNVSCSWEELERFVRNIDKKEFDLENAFDKYYSLDRILFAIKRYENKEINDKYLACWMNAYNWIINAGFKLEHKGEPVTFKEWMQWLITEWIDSLSFFDALEEWCDLEEFKSLYATLDKVYGNLSDWKCFFAHTDELGDNDDDVVVLAWNDKAKEFIKLYGQLEYLEERVDFERVEQAEMNEKIARLAEDGYQELIYHESGKRRKNKQRKRLLSRS